MVKRGRPSLNLTPEERLQRRRSQLVASQRKRRAHKRLSQPSKPSSAATSGGQRPNVPVPNEALCQYYDAMFLGQDAEIAVSQHRGVAAASKTPSPDCHQSSLTVCHRYGSAPLDMATLTAAMSSSSPASLLWTAQLGTDAYALSSRLASPLRSSAGVDYTSANGPDNPGTDEDIFTEEHLMQTRSSMPPFALGVDSFDALDIDLDGGALLSEVDTRVSQQKCDAQATVATRIDNVFLPGLSGCANPESFWMPSSPPRTVSTLTGPMLSGPALCDESDDGVVDLLASWAGAKQVSLVGEAPRMLDSSRMAIRLLRLRANFTV
ncbi:hypothetical protein TARUN_1808 [Trichoderma arundinaceum]|uniref:Uncharacterized protein n=1 Tax=Trichoderma arundinaceum TaxID=490622 RepID=A0A395NWE2_TRIAR|nr:hypothetical protein TARUN_1808 [Trichoderma arundinaceum]